MHQEIFPVEWWHSHDGLNGCFHNFVIQSIVLSLSIYYRCIIVSTCHMELSLSLFSSLLSSLSSPLSLCLSFSLSLSLSLSFPLMQCLTLHVWILYAIWNYEIFLNFYELRNINTFRNFTFFIKNWFDKLPIFTSIFLLFIGHMKHGTNVNQNIYRW